MKQRRVQKTALTLLIAASLGACGSKAAQVAAPTVAKTTPEATAPTTTGTKPTETKAGNEITSEEREAMLSSVKSGGAPNDIAKCVTDGLAAGLTREQFIAVTKAKSETDVPKEISDRANEIARKCAIDLTTASSTVAPVAAVAPVAPDTTIAASTQTIGKKDSPITFATVAKLENGYDVTVNSYAPNASTAVAAISEYNDKPAAGTRYVLINLMITNSGGDTDKRQPGYDLIFKAVSESGKSYENSDCSAVTPDPLDRFTDLFKGTSITGNVCFLVDEKDATNLTLYTDVFTKDYSTLTYYFNLG
jgi:hypothetical protein